VEVRNSQDHKALILLKIAFLKKISKPNPLNKASVHNIKFQFLTWIAFLLKISTSQKKDQLASLLKIKKQVLVLLINKINKIRVIVVYQPCGFLTLKKIKNSYNPNLENVFIY
jgi:hypothetical protein